MDFFLFGYVLGVEVIFGDWGDEVSCPIVQTLRLLVEVSENCGLKF